MSIVALGNRRAGELVADGGSVGTERAAHFHESVARVNAPDERLELSPDYCGRSGSARVVVQL
jgi:hypothetical protein